jgi:putative transposase
MRWMCEALDVSRGGYYAWLKRPPSAHERRDEELQGRFVAALMTAIRPMERAVCVEICAPGASFVASIAWNG